MERLAGSGRLSGQFKGPTALRSTPTIFPAVSHKRSGGREDCREDCRGNSSAPQPSVPLGNRAGGGGRLPMSRSFTPARDDKVVG